MQKRPTEIVSLCKVLFQSVFCYVSDNMSIMVSVCLSIFISSFLCQALPVHSLHFLIYILSRHFIKINVLFFNSKVFS